MGGTRTLATSTSSKTTTTDNALEGGVSIIRTDNTISNLNRNPPSQAQLPLRFQRCCLALNFQQRICAFNDSMQLHSFNFSLALAYKFLSACVFAPVLTPPLILLSALAEPCLHPSHHSDEIYASTMFVFGIRENSDHTAGPQLSRLKGKIGS